MEKMTLKEGSYQTQGREQWRLLDLQFTAGKTQGKVRANAFPPSFKM